MEIVPTRPHLRWRRLEHAKRLLDLAHKNFKTIADMPPSDGHYGHGKALLTEESAVKNYLRAVRELKAALLLKEAPACPLEADDSDARITVREQQVLRLIASGKSSKEIAEELGITFKTAVCHRYRLCEKLNAHKTADLTRAAIRMGLIEA